MPLPVILLGNKCDLDETEIGTADSMNMMDWPSWPWCGCSDRAQLDKFCQEKGTSLCQRLCTSPLGCVVITYRPDRFHWMVRHVCQAQRQHRQSCQIPRWKHHQAWRCSASCAVHDIISINVIILVCRCVCQTYSWRRRVPRTGFSQAWARSRPKGQGAANYDNYCDVVIANWTDVMPWLI